MHGKDALEKFVAIVISEMGDSRYKREKILMKDNDRLTSHGKK